MKKLHTLAFYSLVLPAFTLSSAAVFAETANSDQEMDNPATSLTQTYMGSAPTGSMMATNLIGANVTTIDDETVGSVSELIIDKDGQIVAVVVGVGGFLGLGEKDVAIGWGDVMHSSTTNQQALRIDVTRDDLLSAPEFVNME